MLKKIIYKYSDHNSAAFVVDDNVVLDDLDKCKVIHKTWEEIERLSGTSSLKSIMGYTGCEARNIKIIVENHEYTLSLKTMFDPINNEMYYYISRQ